MAGRRPGPAPASPQVQALRKTAPSRRQGAVTAMADARATGPMLPIKPPPHLVEEAAACWIRVTTLQHELKTAGQAPVVTAAEHELLEVACVAYRQWRLAVDAFNEQLEALRASAKAQAAKRERAAARKRKAGKRATDLPPAPDPHAWHLGQLALKEKDGDLEMRINSYQMLVERTGETCRKAFVSLGLPRRTPTMIAQIEEHSASGKRKAYRLMLGGS